MKSLTVGSGPMTKLAGITLVLFLIAAPKWAAGGYSAAGERQRYAESLMPEESEMQYFASGTESQILNIALPEKDNDDVTCDAIVANILADASFTAELKSQGFTHVGCGTAVTPIVVRRGHELQRSPIQDDGRAGG
jgi:hypothetical protein